MTRNLFEVIKARLSILGISSQQNIESGKYQALVFSEKGKGNLERINDTKKNKQLLWNTGCQLESARNLGEVLQ